MNRFREPIENKHGLLNMFKSNYYIPVSMNQAMGQALPIWELIGLTEEDYLKKYHKPAVVVDETETIFKTDEDIEKNVEIVLKENDIENKIEEEVVEKQIVEEQVVEEVVVEEKTVEEINHITYDA